VSAAAAPARPVGALSSGKGSGIGKVQVRPTLGGYEARMRRSGAAPRSRR
jgi:hypothetical protein